MPLQSSDWIIFMGDKGKILAQGTHDQLMSNSKCLQYRSLIQSSKTQKIIQQISPSADQLTPEVTSILLKLHQIILRDDVYREKFQQRIEEIMPLVVPRMTSAISGDISSLEMNSIGSRRDQGLARGKHTIIETEDDEDSGSM